MKLPGEAWLEFKIVEKNGKNFLQQTATFRPKGLLGRMYDTTFNIKSIFE